MNVVVLKKLAKIVPIAGTIIGGAATLAGGIFEAIVVAVEKNSN